MLVLLLLLLPPGQLLHLGEKKRKKQGVAARPREGAGGGPCTHLCSLVLEPDLHHADAQPRLGRQRLPHLEGGRTASQQASHGFGGDLRRGQSTCPASRPPRTFLQGLEETSKDALNALRCCVVRMVRGRLGRLWSFPSSAPFPEAGPSLQMLSSSSLLPWGGVKKKKGSRVSQESGLVILLVILLTHLGTAAAMALLAALARGVQCRLAGTHPSLLQAINHSEPFPESSFCLVIATEAVFEAIQHTAGCKAELGLGPVLGLPCPRDARGGCGAGGGSTACGGAGMLSSHGCFLGSLLG